MAARIVTDLGAMAVTPAETLPEGMPHRGTSRDTSRATAGTTWPRPGHRQRHRRGQAGGVVGRHRSGASLPAPGWLAHSFACTSCTARTRNTTSRLAGSIKDSPKETPMLGVLTTSSSGLRLNFRNSRNVGAQGLARSRSAATRSGSVRHAGMANSVQGHPMW